MRTGLPAGRVMVPTPVAREARHDPAAATTTVWCDVKLPSGAVTVTRTGPAGATRVQATVDGAPFAALVGDELLSTTWVSGGSPGPAVEVSGARGTSQFVLGRPGLGELGRRRHLLVEVGPDSWSFALRRLVPVLHRGGRPTGEPVARLRPGGPVTGLPPGADELVWVEGATGVELVLTVLLGLATPEGRLTSLVMKLV